jgi:hypothetical protein
VLSYPAYPATMPFSNRNLDHLAERIRSKRKQRAFAAAGGTCVDPWSGRFGPYLADSPWSMHMMLPSLSLNHADLPIPGMVATEPFHSTPGMS